MEKKFKLKKEDCYELSGGNRTVLETIPLMMEDKKYRIQLRALTIKFLAKRNIQRGRL